MSDGAKAGIAIGVIAFALIVCLVVLVVAKRRNQVPSATETAVNESYFINKLYFAASPRSDSEFQPTT